MRALFAALAACLMSSAALADDAIVFNVPKVVGSSVPSVGWGMPITRLIGPDRRFLKYPPPNASFRLAWDGRDLIILADVEDRTPNEAEGIDSMFRRDSIELYVAADDRPDYALEMVIAPGDGGEKKVRVKVKDKRGEGAPEFVYTVDRLPREDGYRLLVRIPLASLGIEPEAGRRLRLQLGLNDADAADQRRAFAWYPSSDSWRDAEAMYVVRLANKSDDRSEVATLTGLRGFRDIATLVSAPRSAAGEWAKLYDEGDLVAEARLTADGESSVASFRLPLEKNKPARRMTLKVDGEKVASVVVPKSPDPRVAVKQLRFQAANCIFWTEKFPTFDFGEPLDAEDLLGSYRISTTYYDAELNPVTEAVKPGRYAAVSKITSASGDTFTRYNGLYRTPAKPANLDWWAEGLKMQVEWPAEYGIDPEVAKRESRAIGEEFSTAFRNALSTGGNWAALLATLSEMKADAPESVSRTGASGISGEYFVRLRIKLEDFRYPYAVSLPKRSGAGDTQKRPLILYLHGSGERGTDLKRVEANHVVKKVRADDLPFIVVSPQCPEGEYWETVFLDRLLNEVSEKYPVDRERVYVTGLSMGGFGTWGLALQYPDRFAAIAPVCGIGDHRDMERIADLPTWVFHGDKDESVPLAPDTRCVESLKQAKGRVRFTVYPGVGHDSWTPTYANPELYKWMLEQKRGEPKEPRVQ